MPKKAVISGVFNTKVGEVPGSTAMSLHAEAARGAVADAGLKLADIDGVLLCLRDHRDLSDALGVLRVCRHPAELQRGCECGRRHGRHYGDAGGGNGRGRDLQTGFVRRGRQPGHRNDADRVVAALAEFGHPQFEVPYGISIPTPTPWWHGAICARRARPLSISRPCR